MVKFGCKCTSWWNIEIWHIRSGKDWRIIHTQFGCNYMQFGMCKLLSLMRPGCKNQHQKHVILVYKNIILFLFSSLYEYFLQYRDCKIWPDYLIWSNLMRNILVYIKLFNNIVFWLQTSELNLWHCLDFFRQ